MFGLLIVGLLMCSQDVPVSKVSRLDVPIIGSAFSSYFATQRPVRVDVSVCAANGKGEKALDFFLVDEAAVSVPNTLREILKKSPFMKQMIDVFFEQGTETLMITEMLSLPGSKEKISNFIGIQRSDL